MESEDARNGASQPADDVGPEYCKPTLPEILSFARLAGGRDEVWLEQGGQIYRLRRTRQGKLILTK